MGKNTSSKEFPTPVESRDRKDKKVNEKKQTNKKDRIKNIAIVFLVIMLLLTFTGDADTYLFFQYDHELFPA